MPSIANIPEPTSAYRPIDLDQPVPHAPIGMRPTMESGNTRSNSEDTDESVVSWLVVILICGILMRLGLLYFGAVRGVNESQFTQWSGLGGRLLKEMDFSATAWPAFAWLVGGADALGLPGWFVVILGMLASTLAIPGAFVLGFRGTGSSKAGLLAAALVSFHPAALAASGALGPGGITLGLLTCGLALVAVSPQRGYASAIPGAFMVGLAGLAAPLVWAAVPLAGVLASQVKSTKQVAVRATVVTLVAAAPIAGWSVLSQTYPWTSPTQATAWPAAGSTPMASETSRAPFSEKLLYAASNHSLPQLGDTLHGEIVGDGPLTRAINPTLTGQAAPDAIADTVGDGWVVLNLAIFLLAAASIGVMMLRGRWLLATTFTLPLLAMVLMDPLLGEPGRVGFLGMQSVLAMGFLAISAQPRLSEEEKASRIEAKLAEREAKDQTRLEKQQRRQDQDLYAFDKPAARVPAARGNRQETAPLTSPTIFTEKIEETPAPLGRPI